MKYFNCEPFKKLVAEKSYESAIELLQNMKDLDFEREDGIKLLLLAVKVTPPADAVKLMKALIKARADRRSAYYSRECPFFILACRVGPDPVVYDELLKLKYQGNGKPKDWWRDSHYGCGVFEAACTGGNIALVEYILNTVPEPERHQFLFDRLHADRIATISFRRSWRWLQFASTDSRSHLASCRRHCRLG